MPFLRVWWNTLAPWRRRRRYYFLRVVAVLRDLHRDPAHPSAPIDERPILLSFGWDAGEFADALAGRSLPPRYVETLARAAYKLPAPSRAYLYRPAVLTITVAVLLLAGGLSLLR